MDDVSDRWVCALQVHYTDGTWQNRVIHRGSEDECYEVLKLIPLQTVAFQRDPHRVVARFGAPELVEVSGIPEGKTVSIAAVGVVHEHALLADVQ